MRGERVPTHLTDTSKLGLSLLDKFGSLSRLQQDLAYRLDLEQHNRFILTPFDSGGGRGKQRHSLLLVISWQPGEDAGKISRPRSPWEAAFNSCDSLRAWDFNLFDIWLLKMIYFPGLFSLSPALERGNLERRKWEGSSLRLGYSQCGLWARA